MQPFVEDRTLDARHVVLAVFLQLVAAASATLLLLKLIPAAIHYVSPSLFAAGVTSLPSFQLLLNVVAYSTGIFVFAQVAPLREQSLVRVLTLARNVAWSVLVLVVFTTTFTVVIGNLNTAYLRNAEAGAKVNADIKAAATRFCTAEHQMFYSFSLTTPTTVLCESATGVVTSQTVDLTRWGASIP